MLLKNISNIYFSVPFYDGEEEIEYFRSKAKAIAIIQCYNKGYALTSLTANYENKRVILEAVKRSTILDDERENTDGSEDFIII